MQRPAVILILLFGTFCPALSADLSVEKMGVRGEFFQKGFWGGVSPSKDTGGAAIASGANCLAIPAQPIPAANAELRENIRTARQAGFRILLVPEIPGADLSAMSAKDQGAWFSSYFSDLIVLAKLAAEEQVEFFSIGKGLAGATGAEFTQKWQHGIAQVRAVYPGWLTYTADAEEEVSTVGFWSALDMIGVSLELALQPESPETVTAEILTSQATLSALSESTSKPVVFTKLALRAASGDGQDVGEEALGIARFLVKEYFDQMFSQPWLQGVYVSLPDQEAVSETAQIVVRDFFESGGR